MEYILIIDDEESVLQCLRKVLEYQGYEVILARGGQEGIELLDRGEKFDFVITEVSMRGKSGNEVAKHLRSSERPAVRMVAMTGADEGTIQGDLFDVSFRKPFKVKCLIEAIRSLSI